jgi:hypothetical protein
MDRQEVEDNEMLLELSVIRVNKRLLKSLLLEGYHCFALSKEGS